MFVGALNQKALAWLKQQRHLFAGREVVVGCSGSFSTELMLHEAGRGRCLAGGHPRQRRRALLRTCWGSTCAAMRLLARPREDAPAWLRNVWEPGAPAVAVLHVLLDMMAYVKQNNPHNKRMWDGYAHQFAELVRATEERVTALPQGMTSFTFGDVFDHFKAHDVPGAVFVCYAPTYKGGYEKMYAALNGFFEWTPPTYELLDEAGRDALLAWCREGRTLRLVRRPQAAKAGLRCSLQERGGMHTVYLYSNLLDRTGYFGPYTKRHSLPLPLANEQTVLSPSARIELLPIKCSDLADYKDQFLAKGIDHSLGMWAFAVCVGDAVVGFLEFTRSKFGLNEVYVNSDFAVPGTQYARLSKLMVMLLVSKDVRAFLERRLLQRVHGVVTTAFTERPVSMKYRGVLELVKRGVKPDGKKYLNYAADFGDKSAEEVYTEWLNKYGSKAR